MRRMLKHVFAIAILALVASPAAAQQTDEQAVRAVVDRLFDGMRSRDTTMMRSVFAEPAQFYSLDRAGSVHVAKPSDFIQSIAKAPPELLINEVVHDVEIRIDGPLATVWTYYDLFLSEKFSHCGYDAMQMLRVGGEWKIVALADTRRTDDCRQQR